MDIIVLNCDMEWMLILFFLYLLYIAYHLLFPQDQLDRLYRSEIILVLQLGAFILIITLIVSSITNC